MAIDKIGTNGLVASAIVPPDNSITAAKLNIAGNGTSGQFLSTDGDGSFSYANAPTVTAPTQQIFSSAGTHTYTKPSGCSKVKVTVIGAGGGGGGFRSRGSARYVLGAGGGGGAGGTAIKLIDGASVGSTETITIGTGGAGGVAMNDGTAGGTSSFGSHCSATGGAGGAHAGTSHTSVSAVNRPHVGYHGGGGVGTGGDLNLRGGSADKVYVGNRQLGSTSAATGADISTDYAGIAFAHRGSVGTGGGSKHIFHNDGGASTIQGGQTVPYGETDGGHTYSQTSWTGGNGQGYGNGGNGGLGVMGYSGGFVNSQNNGGTGSAGVVIVDEFYS